MQDLPKWTISYHLWQTNFVFSKGEHFLFLVKLYSLLEVNGTESNFLETYIFFLFFTILWNKKNHKMH